MKLIVGLGNPGRKHEKNRHNLGFMCLNYFARTYGIKFDKKRGGARIGVGLIEDIKIMLARPQTYMNESGLAVSRLVEKFNISLSNLLVIHDDLDLPVGKIRFHHRVGWIGHKGVHSIRNELGSGDFSLLRVGIDRPKYISETKEEDIIDYVLGDFTYNERQIITLAIPKVSEAILFFLIEGLTKAMNKYNKKTGLEEG